MNVPDSSTPAPRPAALALLSLSPQTERLPALHLGPAPGLAASLPRVRLGLSRASRYRRPGHAKARRRPPGPPAVALDRSPHRPRAAPLRAGFRPNANQL